MPKVSVAIPTYNTGHFLDDSITSVLSQTFEDFELIVVDNCSIDNTKDIVSKYLSDSRVKYYVNEKNIGAIGNFNRCLSLATGEYVKLLCSDDKFHPQLLEKFVATMEEHPDVSLVSSYFYEFGLETNLIQPPFYGLIEGKTIIKAVLTTRNFLGNPSQIMLRKRSFKEWRFKEMSLWNADLELFLRVLALGNCFIIPEVLSYARVHSSTISQALMKNSSNYLGEYELAKLLETNDENLDFSGINLNRIVKRKAAECSLAIPHTLLGIKNKQNRQIFKKAFKIAYNEGVLFDSLLLITNKLIRKVPLFHKQA